MPGPALTKAAQGYNRTKKKNILKGANYAMTQLLKKLSALLLVSAVVFSLASCKGGDGKTTTAGATSAGGTTTVAATSDATDTTAGETTTGETTTTTVTTLPVRTTRPVTTRPATTRPATTRPATTKPTTTRPTTTKPTTTKPAGITFPVNGSMSNVLAFYNKYANAMKTYKGKVTVAKKDGTVSAINSITGGNIIKNLALDMLPNDYTTKPTYSFVNGVSTKDNISLSKWLPRGDYTKMSELAASGANGVKSAACVKSGTGCKVTIVMNDDKTSGATALSDKPKYVSKCMDTLDLKAENLEPFTLENATVNYTGCKIEAIFNAQGLMTKLDITTPANIIGKLKYGIIGINADVTGTYRGNYTFTY